uniref:Uncharacterized protein n=1 Tax=Lepeophtheirus salmonis TaxID=72036 RepID=A0A0K2TN84_LEPSM
MTSPSLLITPKTINEAGFFVFITDFIWNPADPPIICLHGIEDLLPIDHSVHFILLRQDLFHTSNS